LKYAFKRQGKVIELISLKLESDILRI